MKDLTHFVACLIVGLFVFIGLTKPEGVSAINYSDIKINELMPHPSSGGEWVELYYRGSEQATQSIDLSGWYFKDAAGNTKTISPSAPAIVEPNKFYLYSLSINGWMNDSSSETIYLYQPDNPSTPIDSVTYGTSGVVSIPGEGRSMGRSPDGTNTWFEYIDGSQSPPTPGTSNPNPQSSPAPSPSPTVSPIPSPSPTPTPTAAPTPSPTPKLTPAPTPTPKPTPKPTPFTITTPTPTAASTPPGEILGSSEENPTPSPTPSFQVMLGGWFTNKLGIGLLAGGLFVTGSGIVLYALERRR